MTYCVGMLVKDGLVMIADTRTNAGVDNISTYRKLRMHQSEERLIAIASAGSLSTTQGALERIAAGIENPETGKRETLDSVPSIYRAAVALGRAVVAAKDNLQSASQASEVNFDTTLLVGGSVAGEKTRLFMVYPAGNAIECGPDTPYLQIGEHKYGKPILDRQLTYDTDLYEAVKIGLISFDSTMRSNLAVGLPIDLLIARDREAKPELSHRIRHGDPYFSDLSQRWSAALAHAREEIPRPVFA